MCVCVRDREQKEYEDSTLGLSEQPNLTTPHHSTPPPPFLAIARAMMRVDEVVGKRDDATDAQDAEDDQATSKCHQCHPNRGTQPKAARSTTTEPPLPPQALPIHSTKPNRTRTLFVRANAGEGCAQSQNARAGGKRRRCKRRREPQGVSPKATTHEHRLVSGLGKSKLPGANKMDEFGVSLISQSNSFE